MFVITHPCRYRASWVYIQMWSELQGKKWRFLCSILRQLQKKNKYVRLWSKKCFGLHSHTVSFWSLEAGSGRGIIWTNQVWSKKLFLDHKRKYFPICPFLDKELTYLSWKLDRICLYTQHVRQWVENTRLVRMEVGVDVRISWVSMSEDVWVTLILAVSQS